MWDCDANDLIFAYFSQAAKSKFNFLSYFSWQIKNSFLVVDKKNVQQFIVKTHDKSNKHKMQLKKKIAIAVTVFLQ